MFTALSSIFTARFLIGHLLPAALFWVAVSAFVPAAGARLPVFLEWSSTTKLEDATLLVLTTVALSILLFAANRGLLRTLEGYPVLRLPLARKEEIARHRRLKRKLEDLKAKQRAGTLTAAETPVLARLSYRWAQEFPEQEQHVLPTRFGNIVRAFEVYAEKMYGIDAIPGWPRLIAVVPKDYGECIDNAKVTVDLWVNIWGLAIVFAGWSLVLVILRPDLALWLQAVPALAVLAAAVAARQAATAAALWGEWVKSAFDLYLPDLAAKAGLAVPATRAAQWQMWDRYTLAILNRRPDLLPDPKAPPAESRCPCCCCACEGR